MPLHRSSIHISKRASTNDVVTEPQIVPATRLRDHIDPYMKLVRLDRPIGTYSSTIWPSHIKLTAELPKTLEINRVYI